VVPRDDVRWAHLTAPPDFVVRTLRGAAAPTKTAVMTELARLFEFPAYFGNNWDALYDCLTDLAWLPAAGYVIVVTDAHQLLVRREADYTSFTDVMNDVGKSWATPEASGSSRAALPFHLVLVVPEDHVAARGDWHAPRLRDCDEKTRRPGRHH
jgi:RNAse (barnase) inhibitor barstar